ncbi:MAG TPA: insulinase family protein [Caldithrix abyssi]|uniref:Insulinase family protein n=1 Tax=Caldithrix abyssi TaxID=187145 RepID=A0A7V4U3B2_CALAY|nr:insulinase family protein [Caldithrix abyssi]
MRLKIDFEQYYLDNGLRVILHEDHDVPIVAVNLWYKVGSKHERPGKTGFAHLFEHMMFQGSQHVPEGMHFQLIQSVGGTLNGSTFYDRTNYFETLPSHYLEMGLWLEADRMGFLLPAMTQEKLDNQRDVVKNERRQRVDNQPYGAWLEKIMELAYPPDYPYHWPVIGYMDDLDNASLEDVSDFFRTYYAPNNAGLVVAGDFDPRQAREMIERHFGSIPAGKPIPPFSAPSPDFNKGEQREIVYDRVQLPRIHLAYHIPAYGQKETYAADMLSDILSEGKSARLYRSLVYEQQIAQEAHAFILPLQETSLFFFVATPKPQVTPQQLEEALQKEIDRIQNEPVSAEEMERTRNQLETRKIRELQSVASRADDLNMFATYFDKPELINTEIEQYEDITEADLQMLAQTYLGNDNRVVVTFLPRENNNGGKK